MMIKELQEKRKKYMDKKKEILVQLNNRKEAYESLSQFKREVFCLENDYYVFKSQKLNELVEFSNYRKNKIVTRYTQYMIKELSGMNIIKIENVYRKMDELIVSQQKDYLIDLSKYEKIIEECDSEIEKIDNIIELTKAGSDKLIF